MTARAYALRTAAVAGLLGVFGWSLFTGFVRRDRSLPVQTRPLRRGDLVASLAYRGRLVCRDEVSLSSRIVGRVARLLVREGERVRKGQPLALFDSSREEALLEAARSNLAEAQSALENARTQFRRAQELYAEQLVAESQYLDARAAFRAAEARVSSLEASLESQRRELANYVVRSPLEGSVTSLNIKEGTVAVVGAVNNPATVMMTIGDRGHLEVEVEMAEADLSRARLGTPAEVRVEAYGARPLSGRLREFGAKAEVRNLGRDNEETFVKAYVALDTVPEELLPGLSTKVRLIVSEAHGVFSVPLQAVLRRDPARERAAGAGGSPAGPPDRRAEARDGVYVIDAGHRLRFVAVRVGDADEESIAVEAPELRAGERVVVGPFRILKTLEAGLLVRDEGEGAQP